MTKDQYPHNPPDGCLDCLRVERGGRVEQPSLNPLVEDLRDPQATGRGFYDMRKLLDQAADEIERLKEKSIDDELALSEHRVIIERLTRSRADLMRGYQNFVDDAGKREERLRAAEVTRAMEAVEYEETINRLRAALDEYKAAVKEVMTMHDDCVCRFTRKRLGDLIAREALRGEK